MGSRLDAPADGIPLGGEVVPAHQLDNETGGGGNGLVHSPCRREPAPADAQILSAFHHGADGAMAGCPR